MAQRRRDRVYSSAVERLTADQQVPGSNPGVPFSSFHGEACSISLFVAKYETLEGIQPDSGVAQWLACWAHNSKVGGSKPLSAKFFPFLRGKHRERPMFFRRRRVAVWSSGMILP